MLIHCTANDITRGGEVNYHLWLTQSSSSLKLPVGVEVATGSVAKSSHRGKLKDISEALESATTSTQGQGPETTSIVKCAVCDNKIVDGKDEALFCEGGCQLWMHH